MAAYQTTIAAFQFLIPTYEAPIASSHVSIATHHVFMISYKAPMATSHAFIVSYTLVKRICNALYKKHTYLYFLFFSSNLSDPYSSFCGQVKDPHSTSHAPLKSFLDPYCISRPLSISLKGLRGLQ